MESRYALGVIVASGIAVLVPWLGFGWPFHDAFYRAMTLLVVASPCALVISIPATIVSAVSNGARKGVLFKGGAHLDALASVRVVALDKTGTLTLGEPELVGVKTVGGVLRTASAAPGAPGGAVASADAPVPAESEEMEADLLRLTATVEALSEHPLGDAIVEAARHRGVPLAELEGFWSEPGKGVEGTVEGVRVRVGRRSWVEEDVGDPLPEELAAWITREERIAATPVFVAVDGRHAGALAIADRLRPRVREAIEALRRAGIGEVVMLTGDDEATARVVAAEVLHLRRRAHPHLLPAVHELAGRCGGDGHATDLPRRRHRPRGRRGPAPRAAVRRRARAHLHRARLPGDGSVIDRVDLLPGVRRLQRVRQSAARRRPRGGRAPAEAARAAERLAHGRLTGSVLAGEYALGELLGRGGMGEIYAARRISDEEPRAVKVLHGRLVDDKEHLERFRREGGLAARLPVEHTARVHEVGHDDERDLHFIAMDYLRGEDMGAYLRRRGPLPLAELIPLARRIAVALEPPTLPV